MHKLPPIHRSIHPFDDFDTFSVNVASRALDALTMGDEFLVVIDSHEVAQDFLRLAFTGQKILLIAFVRELYPSLSLQEANTWAKKLLGSSSLHPMLTAAAEQVPDAIRTYRREGITPVEDDEDIPKLRETLNTPTVFDDENTRRGYYTHHRDDSVLEDS